MILVDSAVWIDLLRSRETVPTARLRKLLEIGEAAAAPVIVQEVLQGAASPAAFDKLRTYFTEIPLAGKDRTVELHIAAAELYARARWQGITTRSPNDCLIATIAVEADVLLLHDDRDYEHLTEVDPRLRLVPRS